MNDKMMVGNNARMLEDVFCFVFPVSVVPFLIFFNLGLIDRTLLPSFCSGLFMQSLFYFYCLTDF